MSPIPQAGAFARQVLLSEVGVQGQARWAGSTVALAGTGASLEAARTALASSGIGRLPLLGPAEAPTQADLTLVLSADPSARRHFSRDARKRKAPALFGWTLGEGHGLFLFDPSQGSCPCLECFETLNPKAFPKAFRNPSTERVLGAAAASEALLFLLQGASPLAGEVWLFPPDGGPALRHRVAPSLKCPARLIDEGAGVTP